MSAPHHVLFLCTGNSCRSQMAEAILRSLGGGHFVAHSAGSHPAGFVHPLAIEALERIGIPMHEDARSKSWDELRDRPMDLVVTVCDQAAGVCPAWLGGGLKTHWPLPDPSFHPGDDDERLAFAVQVAKRLHAKIERLIALDLDAPDQTALRGQLDFIGQM